MKNCLITVGILLFSTWANAQTAEIESAEQLLQSGDIPAAIEVLVQIEDVIDNADATAQSHFHLLRGETYLALAVPDNDFKQMKKAAQSFYRAQQTGTGEFQSRLDAGRQKLRMALVTSAIDDQNAGNFALTSEKLYTSYQVGEDLSDLYYAAENSVSAKDYPRALEYYDELLGAGYTGVETEFVATEAATGNVVVFADKGERDLALISRRYSNPGERESASVKGDIIQKMMLIHISQGQTQAAMTVVKDARSESPDDLELVRLEADLAARMGDFETYDRLMQKIIVSDPENPELYYDLGVNAGEMNRKDKALEYYKKALELKPGYTQAELNIATLLLRGEAAIVAEMNGLGTSASDTSRYDSLDEQRRALYAQAIPYLESASRSRPDDRELTRKLMNLYLQLGQQDQYQAARVKLSSPQGPVTELAKATSGAEPETTQTLSATGGSGDLDVPNEATAAYNRGIELYNNGMLAESIAAFEEAVNAWPEFSEAHYQLGMTAFLVSENDKARLHLGRFVELAPESENVETAEFILAGLDESTDPALIAASESAFDRAQELYDEGRLEEAMISLEEAIYFRPSYSEAHLDLGMLAFMVGENELARQHLETFLELEPEGELAEMVNATLSELN